MASPQQNFALTLFSPNPEATAKYVSNCKCSGFGGNSYPFSHQKIPYKNIPSIDSHPLFILFSSFQPKHQATHLKRRRLVPAVGLSGKYQAFVFISPCL